jgi:hypothetical protein
MILEAANPFAQPPTPDVIVAQLTRQLADDYPQLRHSDLKLDDLVDRSVRELWRSPVKTFVPIFALRDVQDEIQARGFAKRTREVAVNRSAVAPRSASDQQSVAGDVTPLVADDVIAVTEDDALRF